MKPLPKNSALSAPKKRGGLRLQRLVLGVVAAQQPRAAAPIGTPRASAACDGAAQRGDAASPR